MGSTAVPGLAAKPIIDILPVVRHIEHMDSLAGEMEKLGYQAMGEFGIPGRRYFILAQGDTHIFHVHSFQQGDPEIDRHLDFVAYLSAHPEAARAYAELKQRLAVKYRDDPESYTLAKTDFIRSIESLAKSWRALQFSQDH